MLNLSTLVSRQKVMISDGAWGTRLQGKGLPSGQSPEIWNLEKPELVGEVATEYIAAGAQLVKTNSFGGNRFKLQSAGLDQRVAEINETAAACSRRAAGDSVLVMGSIGPTGKMLIMQEVSEDEMLAAFSEQAAALARGGADLILVETMSDLDEARIAVAAAREASGLEIACTMTFEKTVSGEYRSMMGVSPSEMCETIIAAGAQFIGSNCGNGIEQMIPIAAEIRAAAPDTPIIIHANAGMPVLVDGVTTFPETPEEMARHLPALVEAGANIIGGCCGTSPEHIRQMRACLDS
jgi:5-methyltetrahydrofolate--homocysteine methyltransferase